jgi:head-tail adaptor
MFNPGKMDSPIYLLTREEKIDKTGAPYDVWTTGPYIWAQRVPSGQIGNQIQSSDATRTKVDLVFRIRATTDLNRISDTDNYRVRFADHDYKVVAILEDLREFRDMYSLIACTLVHGLVTLTADVN